MSAFIVSPAHIDALIQAGLRAGAPARGGFTLQWRIGDDPEYHGDYTAYCVAVQQQTRELTRATADRVGAMLWNENKASVDHRYQEANEREVYDFTPSRVTDPVTILKSLACYEYQSCEHPAWEASEAKAFCEALRDAVITMLPGYDAAPWGIEDHGGRS